MLHEFKFPKLSFGFYGFILILNNTFYHFKDLGHSMGKVVKPLRSPLLSRYLELEEGCGG